MRQWHQGDAASLEALIALHLPWIREYVRQRVGPALHRKEETDDFIQEAMIQFLRYGPRVMLAENGHFRRLMARIVENAIRDRNDWFRAKRRALSRERPLGRDTVLYLDPPREGVPSPSDEAAHHEDGEWIRLGIELIDPADRDLIVLREWEKLSFPAIGERLGITPNAAEKRFRRAVRRLGEVVGNLRRGRIDRLEADDSAQ